MSVGPVDWGGEPVHESTVDSCGVAVVCSPKLVIAAARAVGGGGVRMFFGEWLGVGVGGEQWCAVWSGELIRGGCDDDARSLGACAQGREEVGGSGEVVLGSGWV